MANFFITNIHINTVDNLIDFDIPLSSNELKHLVITGSNGSGKTRLLESLRDNMAAIQQEAVSEKESNMQLVESYHKIKNSLSLSYRNDILHPQDVSVLYFSASRSKVSKPKRAIYSSIKNPNFLDYMLSISDNSYNHPEQQ
jgi:predicted ATP-binding protein involved in virulence